MYTDQLPEEFLDYLRTERTNRSDDTLCCYELAHYEWVQMDLILSDADPNKRICWSIEAARTGPDSWKSIRLPMDCCNCWARIRKSVAGTRCPKLSEVWITQPQSTQWRPDAACFSG